MGIQWSGTRGVTSGAQTIAGVKTFSDTTPATSRTTGCVILGGGLGIGGNVWGGSFNAAGPLTVTDSTASTSTATGCGIFSGGLGVAGAGYFGGLLSSRLDQAAVTRSQFTNAHASGYVRVSLSTNNGDFDVTGSSTANGGALTLQSGLTGGFNIVQDGNVAIALKTNAVTRLTATGLGSVVVGAAALATNATDGFLYIPTCAGTPTGAPTAQTGAVAMVFDTTNNKLYIYDGSWLGGTAPGAFT